MMKYGAVDPEPGMGQTDFDHALLDVEQEKSCRPSKWLMAAAVLVTTGVLASFSRSAVNGGIRAESMELDSIEALSLAAFNEYGNTKTKTFAYPFLADSLLAEPYKTAIFEVQNAKPGCEYTWSITQLSTGDEIDSGVTTTSNFTSSEFEAVGQYTLDVKESNCDNSHYKRTLSQSVWVKYVRRELMTLTDSDREAFLNAFHTLWEVNTVDGMALYGEEYKSVYYFASIHNDAGANSVCDEFHGGSGFVNNHMMLGMYLEQSMQLVDPSTCLHYMEYVKYFEEDAFADHLANQLDGGAWTPIMTDLWFGSNDPYTGRIIDSRWANTSVPYMNDEYFANETIDPDQLWFPADADGWTDGAAIHVTSPYGLLRSPWNWNPDPYVARYNNMNRLADVTSIPYTIYSNYDGVKCAALKSFVENKVAGESLSSFLLHAEDQIHGKVHFTIGGGGGSYSAELNTILQNDYGLTDSDMLTSYQGEGSFVKRNYPIYDRNDYAKLYDGEFPFTCTPYPWNVTTQSFWTTDQPGEANAICTLNPYYCESANNTKAFWKIYLATFQSTSSPLYDLEAHLLEMDADTQCEIAEIFVNRPVFNGEMAGSGAALDPMFWVVHGSVERLLHKVIFENMTSDYEYTTTAHCSGHVADGTKYWLTGYSFEDPSIVAQNITNSEFAEILNPVTDKYRDYLNFIYDSSSYEYCDGSDDWWTV